MIFKSVAVGGTIQAENMIQKIAFFTFMLT